MWITSRQIKQMILSGPEQLHAFLWYKGTKLKFNKNLKRDIIEQNG